MCCFPSYDTQLATAAQRNESLRALCTGRTEGGQPSGRAGLTCACAAGACLGRWRRCILARRYYRADAADHKHAQHELQQQMCNVQLEARKLKEIHKELELHGRTVDVEV